MITLFVTLYLWSLDAEKEFTDPKSTDVPTPSIEELFKQVTSGAGKQYYPSQLDTKLLTDLIKSGNIYHTFDHTKIELKTSVTDPQDGKAAISISGTKKTGGGTEENIAAEEEELYL